MRPVDGFRYLGIQGTGGCKLSDLGARTETGFCESTENTLNLRAIFPVLYFLREDLSLGPKLTNCLDQLTNECLRIEEFYPINKNGYRQALKHLSFIWALAKGALNLLFAQQAFYPLIHLPSLHNAGDQTMTCTYQVSQLGILCSDKIQFMVISHIGTKAFIRLTFPHHSSSSKEVRAGIQAGADTEAMEKCFLLVCSP